MIKTVDEVKNILEKVKPELEEKYRVKKIGIFGSYVKNQQKIGSDIDILVEYSEVPDLFAFIDLKNYLSDLLNMNVDLVMKSALKPNIGKRILKEVTYL